MSLRGGLEFRLKHLQLKAKERKGTGESSYEEVTRKSMVSKSKIHYAD